MVALHPEGVDRNFEAEAGGEIDKRSPSTRRAWIEIIFEQRLDVALRSPSTRRAWIEIKAEAAAPTRSKESPSTRRAWIEMTGKRTEMSGRSLSPSTRRAWIEITNFIILVFSRGVALHPEGVDRNREISVAAVAACISRPPPGGRG